MQINQKNIVNIPADKCPVEPITKVIFRRFKDGDIIALFPELPGNSNPATCLSYMHIGQHSAAHYELVRDTTPARPLESFELYKELESIGYRLRIVKRITYKDMLERIAALKEVTTNG